MALTAPFSRIMDNLRIRVPGALDDGLKHELWNAVDEFLRDTNVWTDEIEFTTSTPQDIYTITPTFVPARIVRCMGLWDANDIPVPVTMDDAGILAIDKATPDNSTLTTIVTLSVQEPVDADGMPQLPAWIVEKYYDGILDGTLARMFSQPAKPFSNASLALLHQRRFAGQKGLAKREANRRGIYRGQAWTFPQAFRVSRRV
jgi:hypothetical protein